MQIPSSPKNSQKEKKKKRKRKKKKRIKPDEERNRSKFEESEERETKEQNKSNSICLFVDNILPLGAVPNPTFPQSLSIPLFVFLKDLHSMRGERVLLLLLPFLRIFSFF